MGALSCLSHLQSRKQSAQPSSQKTTVDWGGQMPKLETQSEYSMLGEDANNKRSVLLADCTHDGPNNIWQHDTTIC